jgi:hypothetical protein
MLTNRLTDALMRGLDPRIHLSSKEALRAMDSRVRPGYDAVATLRSSPLPRVQHVFAHAPVRAIHARLPLTGGDIAILHAGGIGT